MSSNLAYKVLMLGDSGVGKTSLMLRHVNKSFADTAKSTLGVGFKLKTYEIDRKTVTLQLWDTAGQEKFRSITRQYYNKAHAIFLVFDLTKHNTFEHLEVWLTEIASHTTDDIIIILVANKSDIPVSEHAVSQEEIIAFTNRHRIDKYFITSAKENTHVDEIFRSIAQLLKIKHNELDTLSLPSHGSTQDLSNLTIKQGSEIQLNNSGCCN